jgi:hypothetical protein
MVARILVLGMALGVALVGVVGPAHAYVMPAEFLVRLLAEARREGGQKDVTLTLNADLADHDHQVDERIYLKRPERFRLVQQDDTTLVRVDREGQSAAGDDRALKPGGPSQNLLPVLLMPRGKDLDEMQARLLKALHDLDIDIKTVTFGRLGDTVVYIIGAHAWETDKPQLWLDKVTFMPVRIILPGKVDNKPVVQDTRLLEYGTGPVPSLPRVFEDWRDGKLQRHAEVTSAQVNQDLPETLFDLGGGRRR